MCEEDDNSLQSFIVQEMGRSHKEIHIAHPSNFSNHIYAAPTSISDTLDVIFKMQHFLLN